MFFNHGVYEMAIPLVLSVKAYFAGLLLCEAISGMVAAPVLPSAPDRESVVMVKKGAAELTGPAPDSFCAFMDVSAKKSRIAVVNICFIVLNYAVFIK
jgi:hypothetical protein